MLFSSLHLSCPFNLSLSHSFSVCQVYINRERDLVPYIYTLWLLLLGGGGDALIFIEQPFGAIKFLESASTSGFGVRCQQPLLANLMMEIHHLKTDPTGQGEKDN